MLGVRDYLLCLLRVDDKYVIILTFTLLFGGERTLSL